MQLLLLSALALTATVVNAQVPTISNCTLGCVNNFCPDFLTTLDFTCLCEDEAESIADCITTTCTQADLTAAEGLEQTYCTPANGTGSPPPPPPPGNGTTMPPPTSPAGNSSAPATTVTASTTKSSSAAAATSSKASTSASPSSSAGNAVVGHAGGLASVLALAVAIAVAVGVVG